MWEFCFCRITYWPLLKMLLELQKMSLLTQEMKTCLKFEDVLRKGIAQEIHTSRFCSFSSCKSSVSCRFRVSTRNSSSTLMIALVATFIACHLLTIKKAAIMDVSVNFIICCPFCLLLCRASKNVWTPITNFFGGYFVRKSWWAVALGWEREGWTYPGPKMERWKRLLQILTAGCYVDHQGRLCIPYFVAEK